MGGGGIFWGHIQLRDLVQVVAIGTYKARYRAGGGLGAPVGIALFGNWRKEPFRVNCLRCYVDRTIGSTCLVF